MIVKINIPSAWFDENESKLIAKNWNTTYSIKATFNDGSDYDSSWSIEGYFENVKKFLIDEYVSVMDGIENLDPDIDEDVIRIVNMN